MIRIDAVRELRRDLHMRPFEADRRVYLAARRRTGMNEDAADALLKDLEEPPPYAVIVLVATSSARCPRRSARAASSCPSAACRSRPCEP